MSTIDLPEAYCYLCGKPMFVIEGVFEGPHGYGLFCDNQACIRYGLFSAISLPEDPNKKTDKKTDKKTEGK
jgi:hypothetical protein